MIRQARNKILLMVTLWMIVRSGPLGAQSFKSTAHILPVQTSGFYFLDISPDISRYLQSDFRDLRIVDEQEKQVPYILEKQDSITGPVYTENPPMILRQTDSSDRVTYCIGHNPEGFHIGKILVTARGPVFYNRQVDICIPGRPSIRETLSSDSTGQFVFPSFKDSLWSIKIYNRDNPPLTIVHVSTYQETERVICYLEAGRPYHLLMNNEGAAAPEYDLQAFRQRIPAGIPALKVFGFSDSPWQEHPPAKNDWISQHWLWPVLLVILGILLLFTWRLTREIGKKDL